MKNLPLLLFLFLMISGVFIKAEKNSMYSFGDQFPSLFPFLLQNLETYRQKKDNAVACSVENFVVVTEHCDGSGRGFSFDFESNDFGLNGYTISNNLGWSQSFTINEYKTFFIEAVCLDELVFVIRDNNNDMCTDTFSIVPECCECGFDFYLVEQSECVNGTFDAIFHFYWDIGSCGLYYDDKILTINGVEYAFTHLGNAKYLVQNIMTNEEEVHYTMTFPMPLNESETFTAINPCANVCFVYNFEVSATSEDCSGELLLLDFDFDSQFFSENGYTIVSNFGHEFHFQYADFRFFEISADCENDYIFTIFDNDDPNCQSVFEFGPICCSCISEYSLVEESMCDNNSFTAWHQFEWTSGSCFTHDYVLTINGENYPFTWVNQTIFRIDGITSQDSLLIYEFCTTAPTGECFVMELPNLCYEFEECSLFFDVIGNPVCENDSVYLFLYIGGQNLSQTNFDVFVNDSFSLSLTYEHDNLYNLVLPDPGTENFILTICDSDHPDCCSERQLSNPCFEPDVCSLVFEELQEPVCDSNNIHVPILIVGQHLSMTGFNVYVNDSLAFFLPFESDSTYNLVLSDPGTENFILTICDSDHPDCCSERQLSNPCFEPDVCSLVFEELQEPVCENGNIHVPIIIVGQNLSMTGFNVYVNDSLAFFLPFESDSTYNLVLSDPGTENFILTICDNDHPDCCSERQLSNPCFVPDDECSLAFEVLQEPGCENGNIHVPIIIVGQNLSMTGFDVFVNDSFALFLPFETDSTYNLNLSDPATENFTIRICDSNNPDCCRESTIVNPCFDLENCWLVELEGKLDVVPPDSLSLVVDYTLGGDCPEVQVATVCLNGVNPVTSEVRNQRYEGVFERVDTDSILVKFCLALTTDTCVYFLVKNPFSTNIFTPEIPTLEIKQYLHEISILNPAGLPYQWQLLDITSKRVVGQTSDQLENRLSLNTVPGGMYIMMVKQNQHVIVKKIILMSE